MRLKNVSGETVDLPTLDPSRVADGDEIDVSEHDAKNLLGTGLFRKSVSKNEKE